MHTHLEGMAKSNADYGGQKTCLVYYYHTTIKEAFLSAGKLTKEYKSMEKPSLIEPSLNNEDGAY